MKWYRWFWILGVSQALAFSAQAEPTSQLDPYPLDEAVVAFRRVKPWVLSCQTQALRQQLKKNSAVALVSWPLAIACGLISGGSAFCVDEETLLPISWFLTSDANKQAKQIRQNHEWISRIYALPDNEREKITRELIANADSYLSTFYALTPQEATELLRSNAVLRALTLRLGEVHRMLKRKKKLNLCMLDAWAIEQGSFEERVKSE